MASDDRPYYGFMRLGIFLLACWSGVIFGLREQICISNRIPLMHISNCTITPQPISIFVCASSANFELIEAQVRHVIVLCKLNPGDGRMRRPHM